MSSGQRLVKYLAIAFAVFLAVSIISGIISVVFAIFHLIPGGTSGRWHRRTTDYAKSFEHVESIKVDNSIGSFRIMTGETFRVEADNVPEDFHAEVTGDGTLKITEDVNGFHFPFINLGSPNTRITLYLPEGFVADYADIEAGAGSISIEGLQTDRLQISAGAGNLQGDHIKAQKADIEGGVGGINLNGVSFTDTSLDNGVGSLNINGELLGRTDISCGVGSVNLDLTGNPSDYGFIVDSGIGRIRLNGEKLPDGYKSNVDSANVIDVEGGIGSVEISLDAE